jgi:hypothetical protein
MKDFVGAVWKVMQRQAEKNEVLKELYTKIETELNRMAAK